MNIGKTSRWPTKNKVVRNQQQYCQQQPQQQQQQQQLSYNPKPLVFYDTTSNPSTPAPTASFLIATSTYTHGSFTGDQYNTSGLTLIHPNTQPYFKPPDVQTFCLVQDRTFQPQEQTHNSYCNISNPCSLQVTGSSTFQFPNASFNPYEAASFRGPVHTQHSNQTLLNSTANLVFDCSSLRKEKSTNSVVKAEISPLKVKNRNSASLMNNSQIPAISSENYSDWPSQTIVTSSSNPPSNLFNIKADNSVNTGNANQENIGNSLEQNLSNSILESTPKTQEENYSDESSTSFDFTIEAEKMVSALCNISSNDVSKEDSKNEKPNSVPLFSGAGDTASNKNNWFANFCTDFATARSVAIQTDGACADRSQYPEMLRKVVYWGCSEAEIVLNNVSKTNAKCNWLRNLSSATKTAITKSATCFPIFAGDQVFVNDLINSLLRISNGWLILDNYLNKQHYPSLNDKFNNELIRCFRLWEESTHELLEQIVHTFLKLQENDGNVGNFDQKEAFGGSFPGDVSTYTNFDLFNHMNVRIQESKEKDNRKNSHDSVSGCFNATSLRSFGLATQKESKLRSKWTVTENLNADVSKSSCSEVFPGQTEISEAKTQGNSRFRCRSVSSTKADAQSLNAEFFHLRSKILTENGQEACGQQWLFKEKKQELDNKICSQENDVFRLRQMDENCESQKCLPQVESSSLNLNPVGPECFTANNNTSDPNEIHFYPSYPSSYDYGSRNLKEFEQNPHAGKNGSGLDLVYVGKSSSSQLELVPKDKMTLLSQIEPSVPDKSSNEMTANLSAWFASMRNSDSQQISFMNVQDTNAEAALSRPVTRMEMPKHADLNNCIRQLQIDANRQFQTLQNMQNVQSAPWNAYNLINNHVQVQQVPEEYDSSEDVRVYMKPGSYNVPKKRHQRRSNRRLENPRSISGGPNSNYSRSQLNYANKEKTFAAPTSSTPVSRSVNASAAASGNSANNSAMKLAFPATPIVPPPNFSLENSPRILKRLGRSKFAISEDVTWKAACASAEILLEALNVKEVSELKKTEKEKRIEIREKEEKEEKFDGDKLIKILSRDEEKLEESFEKDLKNDACSGISSYEASEDDSGSTNHFSPNTSINEATQVSSNKNGSSKKNVKTDSWLIKTLNNANMVNKQKRRKNNTSIITLHSSESSNSSITENKQTNIPVVSLVTSNVVTAVTSSTTVKSLEQTVCSRKSSFLSLNNDQTSEETEKIVGKATYSETVRRCSSLSTSFSEKKEFCKKSKLNIANVSTICNTVIPIPGLKCQRKDFETSYYLLHNNRSHKYSAKKSSKNCSEISDAQVEGSSKSAGSVKHGRKRENSGYIEFLDGKFSGGRSGDRGWSVWYSSKKKQSLSPLALSKLEMIHQAVWQMEEAEVFKCPSSANNSGTQSSTHTIEDYCKVIQSPMFLETVEYKLKNRVYNKVEHAIRDFRRIVYNSKLYHKDDHDRVKIIETLSKRLEELFEEHFASWDFNNISGSPREGSPVLPRFKTGQRSLIGRHNNAKKSPSPSVTENA